MLKYRFVLVVVICFAQSPVLIDISDELKRGKMVRPVPGLCVWWAISFLCLSLLRLLGPPMRKVGSRPVDLFSGLAVSLLISVSEPMSDR